jgi:hypothetical protein
MRVKQQMTEATEAHARKDSLTSGGLTNHRLIATKVWTEKHPYGFPISLIIACNPIGEVVETGDLNNPQPGDRRWFSEIPPNIIPEYHPEFLEYFLEWFTSGRPAARML